MRGLLLVVAAGLVLSGMADVRAATEPSTISPGGGKSPVTGGRSDEQSPQLGPGNRGTGQLGRPLINPNQVRSESSGSRTIVGQVLSIRGDTYIVREPDGHEVVLKSTKATDVQSVINMGQTVEAQVDSTGALTQIKPAER
jgi:hypothetical protein